MWDISWVRSPSSIPDFSAPPETVIWNRPPSPASVYPMMGSRGSTTISTRSPMSNPESRIRFMAVLNALRVASFVPPPFGCDSGVSVVILLPLIRLFPHHRAVVPGGEPVTNRLTIIDCSLPGLEPSGRASRPCRSKALPSTHPFRRLDPFLNETVLELRAHEEFAIQGHLDRRHPRELPECVGLRGELAETVRPAEDILAAGFCGLVDQDGLSERSPEFGKRCRPGDDEVVDEPAGVVQEAEAGHDEDRLAPGESLEMPPDRLRT